MFYIQEKIYKNWSILVKFLNILSEIEEAVFAPDVSNVPKNLKNES